MRRRTLGRGLSELISGDTTTPTRSVLEVPVNRISPNPMQPRLEIDGERLEELTLSIEAHGVLQPITVRRVGEDYEIIAGERRWRAAQRAGLQSVPCLVQDVTDEESLQLALIENLQREDLNAVEAARGYRRLQSDYHLTQEQLASLIGKSRSAIANTLRLLELPAVVQEAIQSGLITEGHGRALLALGGDAEKLLALFAFVAEGNMTVRETEQAVRDLQEAQSDPGPKAERSAPARVDPNLKDVQDRIQGALATKVNVKPNARGGGKIEVFYSNNEEFDRLLELFLLIS